MLKKIVWLLCVFILSGCEEKSIPDLGSNDIKALSNYVLSYKLDSLLTSYVNEYNKEPAYAVFIDKRSERQNYIITIAPFYEKVNNMYKSGAINYLILFKNKKVFLYTGLEDFISYNGSSARVGGQPEDNFNNGEFKGYSSLGEEIDFEKSWSYVHLDTASYIVRGNYLPFMGDLILKPTIQFKPPDSAYK